jgi:branched-subunit amino acid transport protein AzlD
MMPDWRIVAVVFAVGAASYSMRAAGFLAASALPQSGLLPRLLRLAPGNLLVSFAAAGILEGGWPSLVGCLGAVGTMAVTKREWAALGAGFGAAALISAVL